MLLILLVLCGAGDEAMGESEGVGCVVGGMMGTQPKCSSSVTVALIQLHHLTQHPIAHVERS